MAEGVWIADCRLQIADCCHLPSAICHPRWCDHVESVLHLLDSKDVDLGALCQGDESALRVVALADHETGALALALAVDDVHASDLHGEDRLDRVLDLGLVRARVHLEGVGAALLDQVVRLLRDDRGDDDVAWVLHAAPPSSSITKSSLATANLPAPMPVTVAEVNTMVSAQSTS